ncbi:MAG TPA: SRPBCC domain-containing protein, partial [Solirubrobacteraceae bacterium]|nr:SRPBCC domain-containing protein [Solirubrobacteraceae bacterium]
MHGNYETIDARPALRFERRVSHPVEAVWRALTEPDELARWFPSAVEVDLRVGREMMFTFAEMPIPDESSTMTGRVTDLDPPG